MIASSQRRATTQVRYRLIDLENAKKEFELLPEIDDENREVGLKQALRLMMPALRELRDKRGYSNERILALLREKGFQIGRSTLKVYPRAPKRAKAATRPAATTSAAASPTATPTVPAGAAPSQPVGSTGPAGKNGPASAPSVGAAAATRPAAAAPRSAS